MFMCVCVCVYADIFCGGVAWNSHHINTHNIYINSVDSHKHFRDKAKLPFQLLSDPKKEVARAFNNLRVSINIYICMRRCACVCV